MTWWGVYATCKRRMLKWQFCGLMSTVNEEERGGGEVGGVINDHWRGFNKWSAGRWESSCSVQCSFINS